MKKLTLISEDNWFSITVSHVCEATASQDGASSQGTWELREPVVMITRICSTVVGSESEAGDGEIDIDRKAVVSA